MVVMRYSHNRNKVYIVCIYSPILDGVGEAAAVVGGEDWEEMVGGGDVVVPAVSESEEQFFVSKCAIHIIITYMYVYTSIYTFTHCISLTSSRTRSKPHRLSRSQATSDDFCECTL